MAPGRVHTRRYEGVWTNEIEGKGHASRHRTKDEAAAAGCEIATALGAEHLIHNADGSVRACTDHRQKSRPLGDARA